MEDCGRGRPTRPTGVTRAPRTWLELSQVRTLQTWPCPPRTTAPQGVHRRRNPSRQRGVPEAAPGSAATTGVGGAGDGHTEAGRCSPQIMVFWVHRRSEATRLSALGGQGAVREARPDLWRGAGAGGGPPSSRGRWGNPIITTTTTDPSSKPRPCGTRSIRNHAFLRRGVEGGTLRRGTERKAEANCWDSNQPKPKQGGGEEETYMAGAARGGAGLYWAAQAGRGGDVSVQEHYPSARMLREATWCGVWSNA